MIHITSSMWKRLKSLINKNIFKKNLIKFIILQKCVSKAKGYIGELRVSAVADILTNKISSRIY